MSRVDPLSALRKFVIDGRLAEVKIESNRTIKIGDATYGAKDKTAWRGRKGKGRHRDLLSIVFFIQNVELATKSYGKYQKLCTEKKINRVVRLEFGKLREYLEGRIDKATELDESKLIGESTDERLQDDEGKDAVAIENEPMGVQIMRQERLITDRNSMLSHPIKSFANVGEMFKKIKEEINVRWEREQKEKQRKKRQAEEQMKRRKKKGDDRLNAKRHKKDSSSSGYNHHNSIKLRYDHKVRRYKVEAKGNEPKRYLPKKCLAPAPWVPIILVPKGMSALITKWNARLFLEHKKFVSSNEARRSMENKLKMPEKVHRDSFKKAGRQTLFLVVDDPKMLSYQDWHQVVAVFASGQKWQFDEYPFSTPAEIFERVRGFHLAREGAEIKQTIKNWNVRILRIGNRRSEDNATVYSFWDILRQWMDAKCNWMNY
mmetsp:Transcript_5862/g.9089  ORF Transcript_5862/g.9089 Transcript_5862/m.9089 type:complete len:431 (-) Transcript_5862:156-1448(-)